jgi:two-component system, response regulator PdtaR
MRPKNAGGTGVWLSRSPHALSRQSASWGDAPVAVDSRQVVAAAGTGKPASILIVEDEALVASCIEEVLGELGFGVAGIAASGPEAIALAAANLPALALVDIRLTGPIDGIELACRLRQELGVRSIFLTGLADADTVHRAEAAQPFGFLAKPFRPSQVFNAIQRALNPQDPPLLTG